MSEIQKCPNLVRGGGVNIFQKCPKFKNVPKVGRGGGSTLIGTLSQIFSIFYFDGSPKPSWDWYLVFTKVKQPTSKASTTKKGPKYEGDLQINIYCNLNRIFINYVIQERGGEPWSVKMTRGAVWKVLKNGIIFEQVLTPNMLNFVTS